jgi:hypothetical protein
LKGGETRDLSSQGVRERLKKSWSFLTKDNWKGINQGVFQLRKIERWGNQGVIRSGKTKRLKKPGSSPAREYEKAKKNREFFN